MSRLRIITRAFLCSALCLTCVAISTAAEPARFIPATPENTRLSDGSPLPDHLGSIGWKWLPVEGNDGVFASIADADHATLMTWVDGLDPGAVYEVFGYFWANGWGLDHPPTREHVAAQFGISLATLHTFDGPDQPIRGHVMSWQVTPGASSGRAHGLAAVIAEDKTLKLVHNEARLIRARLGRLHADADGRLPVFFSAYPYRRPSGPAWIDGVGVRKVEAEGPLEEGWKKGTWLHLAIRAGDTITIGRELRRGVDVNVLDEEHLSPLFHAVMAGDEALVKNLLELGADPDLKAQSGTPLAAAALTVSEPLVKLLLDAGADVPAEVANDSGTLSKECHPGNLHPVICAIRSGSVTVLEMLLAKQPGIDLRKLVDMKAIPLGGKKKLDPPDTNFIRNAIDAGNWRMAEWLLDAGFADREPRKLDGASMAHCVAAGEPARPVMEALIKAGVKAVDFSSGSRPNMDINGDGRQHDGQSGWMLPKDALSAAVWVGDTSLVQRFLSGATYAPLDYIDRLFMTATYRQDGAMVDLIRNHFRRVDPLRWKPSDEDSPASETPSEDARVFLPRTTPPPPRGDRAPGKFVLGTIASPDAMDVGALLTASASSNNGWQAVDRDEVESAMLETRIAKPWLDGSHQVAPFGDKLGADALAIIDVIKVDRERVYAIEMVEVATGLVIHREHLSSKVFKPEEDMPGLLDRTARALEAAGGNERRQAVTLLSFSARGGLPNALALASLLHATIQHRVDSTSGFISLTRSQSARLVEEQAIQGKDSLWGAAHLVEGSVSPAEAPGTIRVSLRLETLGADRTSKTIDVEVVGPMDDPAAVMTTAWDKLLVAAQGTLKDTGPTVAEPPPAAIASEEAKRLLRESEWLMSAKMDSKRVLPLIESASALGAPHGDLIRIHLDHLFRRITSLSYGRIGIPDTAKPIHMAYGHLRDLPVAFDLADRMADELPQARELLHHASFYFTRHRHNLPHPRSRKDHHGNEFYLTIHALSYMRAALFMDLLTPAQRADYELLGRELDAFTKEYYTMLSETPQHDVRRSALPGNGHRWILKRNPEILRGILRSVHQVNQIDRFFPHGSLDRHQGLTALAGEMLHALEQHRSPKTALFKADLRCYLAKDGEAPHLTRQFISAAMDANRADWYELAFSTRTSGRMVARHTPSMWFGECLNGGSMLPTLVHAPRMTPEAVRKADVYLNMQFYRSGLPHPMDSRWYQIGSSETWYDRKMQEALTNKDMGRLGELLDALPLHLMYSGHNHQPLLGKRFGNSLRQATQPVSDEHPVTGTLLADLRNGTSSQTGCAYWFLRDQDDPGLLWIFYFASTGHSLGAGANGMLFAHGQARSPMFRRTWLLGLDCRSGKIKTKVDLQQATLQAIGCNQPPADSGPWDMALDQNKNFIITNMMISHGRGNSGHGGHRRIIVIDKASGAVHALPEELEIADFTARETHAGWANVAGLGDEFYFIDENGYRAATATNRNSGDRKTISIYRVGPDLKPSPLVEHGRRPAISPFDGPDTIPTEIAVDDNRLLVYNGDKHYHFNPNDMSWDLVKDHHTKFGFKMYHFAQRERQRSIGAIHHIQDQGQDTGWKVDFEKLKTDRFWCVNDKLGAAELRVDLEIPKDFRDGTTMVYGEDETLGDGSKSPQRVMRELSSGDYIAKRPFHLVILNQTDDSLIVGMQSEPILRWKRPSREGLHLPFLWKIPKKEILVKLTESASADTNE